MKKILIFMLLSMTTVAGKAQDRVTATVFGDSRVGSSWTINIGLENSTEYNAFQMDISLPDEVSLKSAVANTERLAAQGNVTVCGNQRSTDFFIETNCVNYTNNVIRVIGYNLGNNSIKDNSGTLLTLSLSAWKETEMKPAISNILFVRSSDLKAVSLLCDGVVFDASTGIDAVSAGTEEGAPAYNLAGQRVQPSYKGIIINNHRKIHSR